MKKPLTIILAVAAIAAIIVSCVFGVQKANFRKTAEDLQAQLEAVTQERDSLRLRLQAARARVDELIARLPVNQERP